MRGSPRAYLSHEEKTLGKAYDARLIRRLWRYVRPYRGLVFLSVGLLMAVSAAQLVQPYLIKRAIDVDIAGGDIPGLTTTVLLYLGAQLLRLVLFYVMRNWVEWAGQSVMAELKARLFDHLTDLSLSFYAVNPPGRRSPWISNASAIIV